MMINKKLSEHTMQTYDDIESSGPEAHSLKFPSAQLRRAIWTNGSIYDEKTDSIISSSHILLSTQGRSSNCIPDQAYWVRRKISETAHGCIRLCVVLVRKKREKIRNVVAPKDSAYVWELTDDLVTAKMSSWMKYKNLKSINSKDPLREMAGMQLVGNYHPNILGCIEAMHDEKCLYLVTPFCKNGDFFDKINERIISDGCYRVDETDTRIWFRQILLKKGVCHNDICLENILINGKICKLIDFGLCLRIPYSDRYNEGCVTDVSADTSRLLMINEGRYGSNIQYIAPELISKERCFDGFASDLWSTGVIFYILLTGHAPFKWAHESDQSFVAIMDGQLRYILKQLNIFLSEEAIDLLNGMLQRDPRKRLTLAQVMTHPWVAHTEIAWFHKRK